MKVMSAVRPATSVLNGDLKRRTGILPAAIHNNRTTPLSLNSAGISDIQPFENLGENANSMQFTTNSEVPFTSTKWNLMQLFTTCSLLKVQQSHGHGQSLYANNLRGEFMLQDWFRCIGVGYAQEAISGKEAKILDDLLEIESQYCPNISVLYSTNPVTDGKVDISLRNEAVINLKLLNNLFFQNSIEQFAAAISIVDRFVVKVKVKPKYMGCVAMAAYALAEELCRPSNKSPPLEEFVRISNCGGSASDLKKMMLIIRTKLNDDLRGVTCVDYLKAFLQDRELESDVVAFLEFVMCSGDCHMYRASCLALALLLAPKQFVSNERLLSLASYCGITVSEMNECLAYLRHHFEDYACHQLPSSRDKLVWTLSKRTLANISSSSPTSLPIIEEEATATSDEV